MREQTKEYGLYSWEEDGYYEPGDHFVLEFEHDDLRTVFDYARREGLIGEEFRVVRKSREDYPDGWTYFVEGRNVCQKRA